MKALIVEDDDLKHGALTGICTEFGLFSDRASSFVSAMRMIASGSYDLVILDITLPTYDITPTTPGGTKRNFGGREILRSCSHINISFKTIVVSGYENFEEDNETQTFDEVLLDLNCIPGVCIISGIQYSPAIGDWKDKMRVALTDSGMTKLSEERQV